MLSCSGSDAAGLQDLYHKWKLLVIGELSVVYEDLKEILVNS